MEVGAFFRKRKKESPVGRRGISRILRGSGTGYHRVERGRTGETLGVAMGRCRGSRPTALECRARNKGCDMTLIGVVCIVGLASLLLLCSYVDTKKGEKAEVDKKGE